MKTYEQLYFFGYKHEFIELIIQTPLENEKSFNFDDFTTFSERVKKSTQETVNKMENRLNVKIDEKIASKVALLDKKVSSIDNKMNSLDNKIENKIISLENSIANIL